MKKEIFRTIKYTLIAMSAGLIQMGSFALLNEILHLDYWVSYLIALVLSVLWNFTLNRRYTFKSASNVPKAMFLVFLYYLVFTPISTWLEDIFADKLGWNEYLVTFLNMFLNFVTEFLFQRFVVFRKTIDTNELAQKDKESEIDAEAEAAAEIAAEAAAETVSEAEAAIPEETTEQE